MKLLTRPYRIRAVSLIKNVWEVTLPFHIWLEASEAKRLGAKAILDQACTGQEYWDEQTLVLIQK